MGSAGRHAESEECHAESVTYKKAVEAAGVDVPVYSARRLPGGGVVFVTRDGEVVTKAVAELEGGVATEAPAEVATEAAIEGGAGVATDDLTEIPGIGPATARRLAEDGIESFAALAAAVAEDDLDQLNTPNLESAREWLAEHGYGG
jgi:hypothetical protein